MNPARPPPVAVLPFGDYWHRQPLAYPAIADRLAGRVTVTDDAAAADLVVFAHSRDLARHGRRLAALIARRPRLRAVLLSEEPFWDTCWSADPFSPRQVFEAGRGIAVPFAVLNHHTAPFYRAERIPYFLLTDPRYIAHYRPLLARNAGMTAAGWLRHWQDVPHDAAFMAEKRTLPVHAPAFPERGVWGLSLFRTRLARHCRGASVLRLGQGWSGGLPRQALPDWHADKLAQLDMACRHVSAVENTHQATYVTEKIFDAFAAGAVPLYVAGPGHDARRLLGEGGWINLWPLMDRTGRGPEGFGPTRAFDAARPVEPALAAAYAAVQDRLARLFGDDAAADAEADRLADGIAAALAALVR
jgi:hypothetical protein